MGEEGDVVVVKKGRLTDSVDHFLDSSPAFSASLRQVFLQFATSAPPPPPVPQPAATAPSSSATTSTSPAASLLLPASSLIPALNTLLQKLADGVDAKLRRLSLRDFTYCDIQALVTNKAFNPYQPIGFKDFEWAAREAFKNMALEKSKRVGLYILGGIVVVHFIHRVARKVPYIGKHVGLLVRILSPTPIMGPLLGFAGAACWEEKILYQMLSL